MEDILLSVGRKLQEIRKEKKMILSEVAQKANVSTALVSKIENGRTVPSLPVLLTLIQALDEDLSNFFRGVILKSDKNYFVIRKSENTPVEREEAEGFQYDLIFNRQLLSIGFEVVLLTLQPNATRKATMTDAFELKYITDGEVRYVIGEDVIDLKKGDSIYFDGRIPHNPQNISKSATTMLVIYFYLDKTNQ